MKKVLQVNDLHVSFDTYAGEIKAVRGVSFDLLEGEVLAVVGESGCGKSVTAQTIMKLNPMPPARIKSGKILLGDKDIVKATEKEMMGIRGKDVSMIFQDPMTCLNPTMQVGKQLTEAIHHHSKLSSKKARTEELKKLKINKLIQEQLLKEDATLSKETLAKEMKTLKLDYKKACKEVIRNNQRLTRKQAHEEAIRLLEIVKIPNPEQRAKQYPHQFSGGMRQRVMIAMALSCAPKLLIADEPTTALDVTIQAQIMDLLKEIKEKTNTAIILITHDLGVVASMADRVAVMYAGKIVETGTAEDIFYRPSHPYTKALLKSLPDTDMDRSERLISIPGTPPDLLNPPVGCGFASRCTNCMKVCQSHLPENFTVGENHQAACWLLHESCPSQVGGEV